MSQQVMVIPFDGQKIGQGFNRETGESIGTALSVPTPGEDPVDDGQKVFTSFQVVTDQDSLRQSLGIDAEIDARYLLFSTDAKVSFTESNAVNSYSSFVAGRSLVRNAVRHGNSFQLTPDADAVLKQDTASGTNLFKTAFGDMFVRDLNTGGEFLVIARITSISQEHQQKLTSSLSASYNGLVTGASFQADFNTALQETQNHTEVSVWMTQSGGIGGQLSFTGPDATKILDRLSTFPESVHEHPVGYEAVLATYDTIPLPVPNEIVKEAYRLVLDDCVQQKMDFLKTLADLDLALSDKGPLLFDDLPSLDDLTHMKGQYRKALSDLLSHAIKVSTGQMNPPQMFVASPAPPPVSFKKKKIVLPVRIPDDLHGKTPELAQQELKDLGLLSTTADSPVVSPVVLVGVGSQANPLIGKVVSSDPAAGTMVALGSTVTLLVGVPIHEFPIHP